ncbi:antitoxin [Actinacidiphila paucisporea]|uniref:MT0933-like antitoxin protein n=1 Tax=Actinacidiphila paucisporea TaxID=310782 RepID=A0A1M7LK38_9ACTN|nr:antitoxin [Actinacidiphila paucisporea]SHM78399.1 MT0933-like antitoxin protein [Actinacidiphila paucisporea]
MSGLGDLAAKAKKAAQEHPDQVDKAADKVQDFVQDHTGHRHDQQIDRGVDAAQRSYGGNADDPERGA